MLIAREQEDDMNKLKELLAEKGISPKDLAEKSGVDPGTLWRHLQEVGSRTHRKISLKHAKVYSKALDMSLDEFADRVDSEAEPCCDAKCICG